MNVGSLASLPDDARVWLFASDREIDGQTRDALARDVRRFTDDWRSHGRPVAAAAEILHDRVLAVAGAISPAEINAGVSGCGVDAMTHAVDAAAASAGLRWISGLEVAYRDGPDWRVVSRGDFRALAGAHGVTPETVVLDLTLDTLGALRSAGVARPAAESWHGPAFWPAPATRGERSVRET